MHKIKLFIFSDQYDEGEPLGIEALEQAMSCFKKNYEAWKDEVGGDFECDYVQGENFASIHDKIYDNFLEIYVRDMLAKEEFFNHKLKTICSGRVNPYDYEVKEQIEGLDVAFGLEEDDLDEYTDAIIIDYSCVFQVEARIVLDYLVEYSIGDSYQTEVIPKRIIDDPQELPEAIMRLLLKYRETEESLSDAYKYGDGDSRVFNELSNKFAKEDGAMTSFWSYVFKVVAIALA